MRGSGPSRRLTLPLLETVPGLAHAFTTKGADPSVALREAAGRALPVRTLRQVHGAAVRRIDAEAPPTAHVSAEGDALVTDRPGVALGVWVADCVPILVCDPKTRALAAVHAGWRGTSAGVLSVAIETLGQAFAARAEDLRVALGPAIGPCCFEVGEEVVVALLRADPGATDCVRRGDGLRVDLSEANRRQAIAAGVPAEQIQLAGLCTVCRPDLLESYRREGGGAGRTAGLIAWAS